MASDVAYLLHRAETEAVRAIACDSAGVAAVHQEMCVLYARQAITALLELGFGEGGPMPARLASEAPPSLA